MGAIAVGVGDEHASVGQHGGARRRGALWGQYAGLLVAERSGALAATVPVNHEAITSTSAGPSARLDPGMRKHFALTPGLRARRALAELGPRLHAQLEVDTSLEQLPRLYVHGERPQWTGLTWPELRVEVRDDAGRWIPFTRDGAPVDERGTEFVFFPRSIASAGWTWEIWWIGEVPPATSVRLHAWAPDGSEHCSAAFEADAPPSPEPLACTTHEAHSVDSFSDFEGSPGRGPAALGPLADP